jgi:hypothetical protein
MQCALRKTQPSTDMSLVWHYTAMIRFPTIWRSGFVDVSRRGFSPPQLPVGNAR